MDLALPEEVQEQLADFEKLLGLLEAKLQPFLGEGGAAVLVQLPPLERAQAQLALAQATAALFRLYLLASGVDADEHETSSEKKRLVIYSKKVRRALSEQELGQAKRSLEVNVAAVNRFISAAVPDLSSDQKAALKAARGKSGGGTAAGASGGKRTAGGGGGDGGQDAEAAAAAFLQDTLGGQEGDAAAPVPAPAGERTAGGKQQAQRR
ncbi:nuclear nucleic acid-binding C1D [Micractinium conductrix]|uniref:Nuclear nucleic acid-binding protein C1D n=1 Tax=Micractinium conductrix TaxID=554055 RepID=A0A2P6UZC0_9CHLO|nr:nuclear nucleic acid-binding C1D [Micractinium conductrix]|eukprot:PSC67180.1 nuclear nucleic acid-binding C1D [Micractinium conductrix]